jgi:hypothetical protein
MQKLLETLREVRELIDGYQDVKDGPEGQPIPNDAMKAVQLLDAAIEEAEKCAKIGK